MGPGQYDPRYNQDGKNTPLVLPPAYGLAQVRNETYTAEGPISYWNAYVAVTQMGGQGNFSDPRLGIDCQALTGHGHVEAAGTARLPAQPAAPAAAGGSFDAAAAARGRSCSTRLRELPRRRIGHRQQQRGAARACGNRRRRRVRGAHGEQGVPDDTAPRTVAARAVLP